MTYSVEAFLDKNNDALYRDLSRAMYQCEHQLMKTLFPEGNPEKTSRRRPATAGSQFKVSESGVGGGRLLQGHSSRLVNAGEGC